MDIMLFTSLLLFLVFIYHWFFSYTFGHGNSTKFDLLFIGSSICSNWSFVALLLVHLVVFIWFIQW